MKGWPSGSSPRGRGKPHDPRVPGRRRRLIPARAGKTILRALRPGLGSAHPRAGGENDTHLAAIQADSGSSPRGRGKHEANALPDCVPGLIPARAGKTRGAASGDPCPEAHPRAGGENKVAAALICMARGSSPRGRGKHRVRMVRDLIEGLIPARAGKTDQRICRLGEDRAHPRAGGENTF